MEIAESVFLLIVNRFCSWIPHRAKPSPMSRDFWMSDESCRVCYECDSPFSLFNRRHHCRVCGLIFCGKCTLNTLPAPECCPGIYEDGEHVRVCNFCFKIKQEESKKQEEERAAKSANSTITPSSSSFSLASSSISSSSTSSSSSSSVNPGETLAPYGYRSSATTRVDLNLDKKQRTTVRTGRSSLRTFSPRGREVSPNPYDFCSNRSDEDETDDHKDAIYHKRRVFEIQSQDEEEDDSCIEVEASESHTKFSQDPEYDMIKTDNIDENKHSEDTNTKPNCRSTVQRSLSKRSIMSSDDYYGPEESMDESNLYTPSLIQDTSSAGVEVLDVENSDSLWIPPPPEDEEDEMGICLVDDDDDNESGWGSLSSSDYRTRERAAACEEQRKAMRAVVDGHFRALVGQLLDGEGLGIEEIGNEGWLEIVTALALQAASLIKPDTSKDGSMDPGGYVKVKCITAGKRFESCVVKGIVCKKNVAHRHMASCYKNARIILLGGALEYQRVSNQLSSLDTLLQQEKDHLSMAVSRIEAHHPNVVLVEKTVARQAQERLLAKEISLVLNVRRHLLERIARCTGAEIVPSPDHLIKSRIGHCELFHIEKFADEGGKKLPKTLMFFEGCPRPLGCTVLLKGSNEDELKRVKHVVQYAIFAAYQLALETSFLVDEGATVPDLPFKSPISVALPEKQSKFERSISIVPGFSLPGQTSRKRYQGQQNHLVDVQHALPLASINIPRWGEVARKMSNTSISAAWSVTSSCMSSRTSSPNASPRAGEYQERRSDLKNNYLALDSSGRTSSIIPNALSSRVFGPPFLGVDYSHIGFYQQYNPRFEQPSNFQNEPSIDTCSNFQVEKANVLDSKMSEDCLKAFEECDGVAMPIRQGFKKSNSELSIACSQLAGGDENGTNPEEFPPSPSDHQSILVSFSSSCPRRNLVCMRGHLFRIKYYGSFDKPLGRFLRDNVFNLTNGCGSCGEPRDAHIHRYLHRQGSLIISVRRQDHVLTGERDGKIWMWHRCLRCPRANGVPSTHRVLMSDAAWGLSFGKFLELSFSNHAAASRLAACGHSLHRDCLRFYGFGNMIACFRYASINVHSVYLPPPKLEFNHPDLDKWLLNEVGEVGDKGKLVFAKVLNTLRQIEERVPRYGSAKALEATRCIADYETLLVNDQKTFWETLQKVATMRGDTGHTYADILELNSTRWSLNLLSVRWNERFKQLQDFLRLQKTTPISRSANLEESSELFSKEDVVAEANRLGGNQKTCNGPALDASEHACSLEVFVGDSTNEAGSVVQGNDSSTNSRGVTVLHDALVPSCECVFETSRISVVADSDASIEECTLDDIKHHPEEKLEDPKASCEELDRHWVATHVSNNANCSVILGEKQDHMEDKFRFQIPVDDLGVRRALSVPSDLAAMISNSLTAEGVSENNEVDHGSRISKPSQETNGTEGDSAVWGRSMLRAKSGEPLENIGGWVETPFSSLYRAYSRGSQSVLTGPSPTSTNLQILYSTMLMPRESRILAVGIDNTVIPVYDDEPTSVIAYALMSHQYQNQLAEGTLEIEKSKEREKETEGKRENVKNKEGDSMNIAENVLSHPLQFAEGPLEHLDLKSKNNPDDISQIRNKENGSLQDFTTTHVKVAFTDDGAQGKIKYMVTCYCAKQFDALRRKCCPDPMEFIRSLCRCKKWGAQGGKSNVFFAKTADDRLVIKQVTRTELESFIKSAPEYFKYLSDVLTSGSPTCLAKILGIFQVTIKHGKSGREVRMDLMAMENLLYGRHVTQLYDLKGSLRSRYNADANGKNKVLLDQNLMLTNPIFIGNKAKRILERAVWNDTSFLASIDVMDYSLLVGVDEEHWELVVGIIDFLRQYTWDKHLETWVKASGILGGPKNAMPTVISPQQYKKRFRKAMKNYFLMVPDQWSPVVEILGPSASQVDAAVHMESTPPAVSGHTLVECSAPDLPDHTPDEKAM